MLSPHGHGRTRRLERRDDGDALLLGRYRVEEERDRSDAGILHDAVEVTTGRRVSVEIAEGLEGEDERLAYLRDARLAQRLEGDHVLRVLEIGTDDDGVPFVVREPAFSNLEREIATNGAVSPEQAAAWTLEAAEAIAEAHAIGMAHGDVGPRTVMLARGDDGLLRVKVAWTTAARTEGRADEDIARDIAGLGRVLRAATSGVLAAEDEALSTGGARTLPNGIAHVVARTSLSLADGGYPNVGELAADLASLAPAGHASARNIAFLLWHAGIGHAARAPAPAVHTAPLPATAPRAPSSTDPHEKDPVQPMPWLGEDEAHARPSARPSRRGLWLAALAVVLAVAAVVGAWLLRERVGDLRNMLGAGGDVTPIEALETRALAADVTRDALWAQGARLPPHDADAEPEVERARARALEPTDELDEIEPAPAAESVPAPLGAPEAMGPFPLGGLDI